MAACAKFTQGMQRRPAVSFTTTCRGKLRNCWSGCWTKTRWRRDSNLTRLTEPIAAGRAESKQRIDTVEQRPRTERLRQETGRAIQAFPIDQLIVIARHEDDGRRGPA